VFIRAPRENASRSHPRETRGRHRAADLPGGRDADHGETHQPAAGAVEESDLRPEAREREEQGRKEDRADLLEALNERVPEVGVARHDDTEEEAAEQGVDPISSVVSAEPISMRRTTRGRFRRAPDADALFRMIQREIGPTTVHMKTMKPAAIRIVRAEDARPCDLPTATTTARRSTR